MPQQPKHMWEAKKKQQTECQLKSTCHGRHLPSNRVKSQTRQARLHRVPRRKPRSADQHIRFSAVAGVAAQGVMLVEIYLAGVHHFPARGEPG